MATGTVSLYDGFYGLNPYNDYGSIYVALIASTYTFDKTHASFSSDVQPDEATGDGYSEVNITFNLDANPTEESDMSGDATFGACTVDDFQYVVYYVNYDVPIAIIDMGSVQSTVDQGVAVSGVLWTLTPAP